MLGRSAVAPDAAASSAPSQSVKASPAPARGADGRLEAASGAEALELPGLRVPVRLEEHAGSAVAFDELRDEPALAYLPPTADRHETSRSGAGRIELAPQIAKLPGPTHEPAHRLTP